VIVHPVSDVLARVRSLNREDLRDAEALLQLCADDRFVLSAVALTDGLHAGQHLPRIPPNSDPPARCSRSCAFARVLHGWNPILHHAAGHADG
jgi:hypothetical protein